MYSQKVNEKPQVINDYEAGRGIPNQVVIGKIEKAIGKWPFWVSLSVSSYAQAFIFFF